MSTTSTLASIFTNPEMLKEIQRINGIMSTMGASTIAESFLFGTSMNSTRAANVVGRMGELMTHFYSNYQIKDDGEREAYWSKFGIYNQIEISVLNKRSDFVADLLRTNPKLAYYLNIDLWKLPPHVLREYSLLAVGYPNITWSLKILALQLRDNTLVQPNTRPCRRATSALFGRGFDGDQLGHTMLCHRISEETGLPPLDVNTALWIFGERFKG